MSSSDDGSIPDDPAERLQHALHRWVAFGIMPLFALGNAGVTLGRAHLDGPSTGTLVGVMLGLALGKPVGIVVFCWLAVRVRVAALPLGIGWRGVLVVGLVAGVGFTMALFIASVAFPSGPLIEVAKLGILAASAVAAIVGLGAGRFLLPVVATEETARAARRSPEQRAFKHDTHGTPPLFQALTPRNSVPGRVTPSGRTL